MAMTKEQLLDRINKHLCPECGLAISEHRNWWLNNPFSKKLGRVCHKTRNELIIDRLTVWCLDAYCERDAYMESYDECIENKK